VPPNFSDEPVTSVTLPTALAFTPDGRLLITRQSGELYVYQNGTLVEPPPLDLSSMVCGNFERGLLGVAVDPAFTTTQHIFVYYTFRKFGVCSGDTGTTDPVNRVSRFTLPISNVIDLNREVVVLDNIPSPHGNHNAGYLHFGADGLLYISAGDGGCKLGSGGTLCADQNDNARSLSLLSGKILRINKDGNVPASNPFFGATGAHRCGRTARSAAARARKRSPGTAQSVPLATSRHGDFYINDVGQDVWEEIDAGQAGPITAECARRSLPHFDDERLARRPPA
jgi:glucose/arabinose dehydrogenase